MKELNSLVISKTEQLLDSTTVEGLRGSALQKAYSHKV